MFNLILFGPPGSGKGTQSANIIERYKLHHISTGDLLREEVNNETKLGIEAKRYMDNGQLVPDEVVIGMIDNKLNESKSVGGFIFDGFPRTTAQAEALDVLLQKHKTNIHIFISLEVPEETLQERLLQRGEIEGRSDDNVETIAKRIVEYKTKTAPVAQFYAAQNKLETIVGVGGVEEIFERICKVIDQIK